MLTLVSADLSLPALTHLYLSIVGWKLMEC